MSDIVFLSVLSAWLTVAATLLATGLAGGIGFVLFLLLYPLFVLACFLASPGTVLTAWLVLAIVNVPIQYIASLRTRTDENLAKLALSSLFLWPIQLAAVISSPQVSERGAAADTDRPVKPSPLPATVRGTVSYCHHHGTERGHDSVWLEEYGELAFVTDSETYDRIGIAEGRKLVLVVDGHADLAELGAEDALWITEGRLDDA